MYPLLMLREEMVCLIILVFLWINGQFYKMGKDRGSFMRIAIFATGHVLFDIITVLTVNNLDKVPEWINFTAHAFFYLFAILFAHEFFCYISTLCFSKTMQKRLRILTLVPAMLYFAILPFLPIEYLKGYGTNYSYGMAAYIGYALAMLYFIGCAILLAAFYKKIESHIRIALIPMLMSIIFSECIQVLIPELLFTGAVATIITIGFFFSLENPTAVFKQKLLVDALTGVKNRHSYEMDIQWMEKEYQQNRGVQYSMLFCDINNLKEVNDKYGHPEGDAYIGQIAQALTNNLKSAEGIYRMGGDEFLAIYRNKDNALISKEIQQTQDQCDQASKSVPYRMSIAIGYAVSEEKYTSLREVLRVADYMMYKNKADMKKTLAFLTDSKSDLNISGLTDRIFDAFAATGDRNYLTLCNMSTNVSRWSKSAVDYFGLPGEFIFDCMSVWMDYIHPDDVADYRADISAVFAGKKKYHSIEYRARNKQGEYVMCTCRGTILKGKNGEPDMFAATLVNHGIAERVDPITGLFNEQKFIQEAETMIREGEQMAFLKISILTFGRINMLYGNTGGNKVLRSFAKLIQRYIGKKDRLFRMNGTRFIICMPQAGARDVSLLYKTLQDAARKEVRLGDSAISLRLAGGAFLMNEQFSGDSTTLRNNLTYALDSSKKEQHGKLVFYGDDTDRGKDYYHMLTHIHQDAIQEKVGFYLKYQPILNMDSGKLIGAEALIRWKNPEYGDVLPSQFIPWLENDPCFFQLGKWILHTALTEAKPLLEIYPGFVVNVNVTMPQLEDERFESMLVETLRETGFPAQNLYLELTERCRELDSDLLNTQIEFFHKLGIRVALDDIGTGFSSLDILLRLPVDEIKLERTFVRGITKNTVNQIFVKAMVDASNRMGCQCCLEGIEDKETYQHLKQYGAASCQGYYFAKPLPMSELKDLLKKQK